MAVRVRLFAAVREAAGTGETEVPPGPLDEVLDELERRYGSRFATRVRASTLLVDGDAVRRGTGARVADGSELAILPPVSGGAPGRSRRDPPARPVGGSAGRVP